MTIASTATVQEAAREMRRAGVGALVVLAAGAPAGIVTERDLAFRVLAEGRDPAATRVAEVMSSPLATIEPAASIEEAARKMKDLRIKRLVVVLGGQVRGILTTTDIAYAEPQLTRDLVEGWVKQRWE